MMSVIILSCVNFLTCVAIYLFNILRPKDNFEKALNAFLIILFVHLAIKLSLLVVLKSAFLYNNNSTGFGVSYGPLLYLITILYINPGMHIRRLLVHMVPLPLFTLVFLVNSAGYLEGIISRDFIDTYSFVYQVFSAVSLLVYPLVAWRLLKKHVTVSTPLSGYKLKLLNSIIRVMLVAAALGLACIFNYFMKTGKWDLNPWLLPYVCFILMLLLILRYKIETAAVSQVAAESVKADGIANNNDGKHYKKSALDEQMIDAYEASIKLFMAESNIHLEPDISLEHLSERAKIPKHHITQVLNERLNKNFYTFINEYRIQDAITKLQNPSLDINILSLAYDCGFNSKSSFNSYFKKITGLTPSLYRKQVQQNIPVTIQ